MTRNVTTGQRLTLTCGHPHTITFNDPHDTGALFFCATCDGLRAVLPLPGADEDAFEITEALPMFLEDQGITGDGGPYGTGDVVETLKELLSSGVHNPERNGETIGIGVSQPEDSDGYRVMITWPGRPFWLASRIIFTGNANGVAYDDFIPLALETIDLANALLHAWDETTRR